MGEPIDEAAFEAAGWTRREDGSLDAGWHRGSSLPWDWEASRSTFHTVWAPQRARVLVATRSPRDSQKRANVVQHVLKFAEG
jgi:hypothetical protein